MFFFSSRRRHTRFKCDWSSDVCSSDLVMVMLRFQKRPAVNFWKRSMSITPTAGRQAPKRSDRKSVVQGKSVDLGGRRIIKKKTGKEERRSWLGSIDVSIDSYITDGVHM